MARLNFFVDKQRCISCFSCQVACSSAHEIPVGVNRRKVITLNEGVEGKEISTTIACQHCEDAPCQQVCPVDCFYTRADGIVLHDKDKCIGCAYCLYACPFGAPQFAQTGIFGNKGIMDKCTMCAGGPLETNSEESGTNTDKTASLRAKCLCAPQFAPQMRSSWARRHSLKKSLLSA